MSENSTPDQSETKSEESFMSHLLEMRDRVMRMVLSILVIFLSLFYWANDIYTFLAKPLTSHLPEGSSMIAIDVASPFLTPFKLVLMLSIFLAMPIILYQLWAFVAPGLYKHEKRLAVPLLISSVLLFYLGITFAYFVVFPLVFGFFTSIGPESVSIATDIGRYLDFVLSLFFGFGLAFEVPVATIIIIALGITTPDKLAAKRPFVIVAAFIIGMLLTPPDVISQLLLAVPMWLLFEGGLIAARYLLPEKMKTRKEVDDEETNEEEHSIGGAAFAGGDYEVVDDPVDNVQTKASTLQQPQPHDTSADNKDEGYQGEFSDNDDDDYDNNDEEDYRALTEEEMDAELDRMDEDDEDDEMEDADDEDDYKKLDSDSDKKS